MEPEAETSREQSTTLPAGDGTPGADAIPWSWRWGRRHPLAERGLFLILLVLLTVPVYRPALNRFFAMDQIWYFAELKDDLSLSNGLRFLDYNAVRTYYKGDQALYRPLLFVWQAIGSSLFGYNCRAWNTANLVLHLLVVYLLYELLRFMQPSLFAGVFALVFSVLTKNCEMVMWNHLGGYLLGYALLILSLLAIQRLGGQGGRRLCFWLAVYAVSISAAMLCYEMAVVSAVLLIGYVGWRWKEGRMDKAKPFCMAAAMFAPLLLFAALYIGHLTRVERLFWVAQSSIPQHPTPYGVRVLASLWLWTSRVCNPWEPWVYTPPFGRFIWVRGSDGLINMPNAPDPVLPGLALVLVFGGGLLVCFRDGFRRGQRAPGGGTGPTYGGVRLGEWAPGGGTGPTYGGVGLGEWRDRAPFAVFLFMVLVAYSAVNNLGRYYVASVTYYTYFFSLISVVLLYSVADLSRVGRKSAIAALVLLCAMGAANARQSYCLSRQVGLVNAGADRYEAMIADFVNRHRNEEGFQFAVRAGSKGQLDLLNNVLDPLFVMRKGFPDERRPPDRSFRVSNLLYSKYYNEALSATDAAHHKYVIFLTPLP